MSAAPTDAVEAARALFEQGRADALGAWLAPDVELRPPTYGKSWTGKAVAERLLGFAAGAMADFRYTDVAGDAGLHVMRFEARVGEEAISGVDLIRCDADGRIVQFEIFARPPKAVIALRDAMTEKVRGDRDLAALMGLA